jgi:hypothetical protein
MHGTFPFQIISVLTSYLNRGKLNNNELYLYTFFADVRKFVYCSQGENTGSKRRRETGGISPLQGEKVSGGLKKPVQQGAW